MKLSFLEIAKGCNTLLVDNAAWLDELALDRVDYAPVRLCFQYIDECTVQVEGELALSVLLPCHRCGESTRVPLEASFRYTIKVGEDSLVHEEEYECSDEDCETMYVNESQFDVDELLREQVQLALPEKILCGEDCKGLCPACGISLNKETCTCLATGGRSPFAMLSKLKK